MKILSVTAQKTDSTGSGVYLTELVREFDKMGHQQMVIGGVYESDKVALPAGVTFAPVYFRSEELPFPITGMSDEMPYDSTRYCDMTEEMTEQFIRAFRKVVKRVVNEFQPDLVICHHLYFLGSMIRELYPELCICGVCHGSDLRQVKKNPWQREYIMQQVCKFNRLFALHKEQKDQLVEFYGCDESLVSVIGTGYNSDVFFRNEEVKQAREDDMHRFIFAGKLSEKKGVKSLLRATHYLKEPEKTEIVLAGGYATEKELNEIKALAEEAPCKITFLGRIPQPVLAEELNKSDVFILPSFFEGLPLVNIEAMACGLRVVCTDLPGIQPWMNTYIPDNGVVFVIPPRMENEDEPLAEDLPGFEKALAEAMEFAYEREAVSAEMIEDVSWKGLANRLLNGIK